MDKQTENTRDIFAPKTIDEIKIINLIHTQAFRLLKADRCYRLNH